MRTPYGETMTVADLKAKLANAPDDFAVYLIGNYSHIIEPLASTELDGYVDAILLKGGPRADILTVRS